MSPTTQCRRAVSSRVEVAPIGFCVPLPKADNCQKFWADERDAALTQREPRVIPAATDLCGRLHLSGFLLTERFVGLFEQRDEGAQRRHMILRVQGGLGVEVGGVEV